MGISPNKKYATIGYLNGSVDIYLNCDYEGTN